MTPSDADTPLETMREPTEQDLAAAGRGALVPSVAMWKWRTGQPQTPMEQVFQWGYVHGHDDRLALDATRAVAGESGTCWFCKGRFPVDALIAGYDTFEEQRLACLACNERMQGNWRPLRALRSTPDAPRPETL